jgi:hypothetical protein
MSFSADSLICRRQTSDEQSSTFFLVSDDLLSIGQITLAMGRLI